MMIYTVFVGIVVTLCMSLGVIGNIILTDSEDDRCPCMTTGSRYEIQCTINDTKYPFQCCTLDHNGKLLQDGGSTGRTSLIRYPQNRTINYVLDSVDDRDEGTYTCQCNGGWDAYEKSSCIKVTAEPEYPQNFTCEYRCPDTFILLCSWTYYNACTKWSFQYSNPIFSGPVSVNTSVDSIPTRCKTLCDDNKSKPLVAYILYKDAIAIEYQTVSLNVTSTKTVGSTSRIYNLTVDEKIMKLGLPLSHSCNVSYTSIFLSWRFFWTTAAFRNGINCMLSMRSEWGDNRVLLSNDSRKFVINGRYWTYNLDGLHPYTRYNVNLSCQIAGSMYDAETISVCNRLTLESVPTEGPLTTNGSYEVYDCNSMMCLKIFIKEQSKYESRGEVVGYKVIIISHSGHTTESSHNNTSTLNIKLKHSDSINSKQFPLKIRIWSKTVKGYSEIPTTLNIDVPNTGLKEVIVERKSFNSYLVSWKSLQEHTYPYDVIYQWCTVEKNKSATNCASNFNFLRVTNVTSRAEGQQLIQGILPSKEGLNFGVSLRARDGYSAIRWEDCQFITFNKDEISYHPSTPLVTFIGDKTIISLENYCSQTHSRPHQYLIFLNNTNSVNNFTFNADIAKGRYELPGLKSHMIYSVQYKIQFNGSLSDYSDSASFNTSSMAVGIKSIKNSGGDGTTIIIVAVVCSIVVAFALIVLISCKIRMYCKKIGKETRDVDVPEPVYISNPEHNRQDLDVQKLGHKQLSVDSGFTSDSNSSVNSKTGMQPDGLITPEHELPPLQNIVVSSSEDKQLTSHMQSSKTSQNISKSVDIELEGFKTKRLKSDLISGGQSNEVSDYVRTCRIPNRDSVSNQGNICTADVVGNPSNSLSQEGVNYQGNSVTHDNESTPELTKRCHYKADSVQTPSNGYIAVNYNITQFSQTASTRQDSSASSTVFSYVSHNQ